MKYFAVFLISFVAMEGVAWLTHKYLMHGPLWFLHRDHHDTSHEHLFQRNDLFFLFFSLPGIGLIYLGTQDGGELLLTAGIGVSLYGFAYFLVHEIFIHRRFNFSFAVRTPYLKALRSAHARHHKCQEKDGAECFGMLLVPFKYYRRAWEHHKKHQLPG